MALKALVDSFCHN